MSADADSDSSSDFACLPRHDDIESLQSSSAPAGKLPPVDDLETSEPVPEVAPAVARMPAPLKRTKEQHALSMYKARAARAKKLEQRRGEQLEAACGSIVVASRNRRLEKCFRDLSKQPKRDNASTIQRVGKFASATLVSRTKHSNRGSSSTMMKMW